MFRIGWIGVALVLVGCATSGPGASTTTASKSPEVPPGMVWIAPGTFEMGSHTGLKDEAPVHPVELDGYFMDEHEVTNAQFGAFVEATGYVTVAEKKPEAEQFPDAPAQLLVPGALVFREVRPDEETASYLAWWSYVPGASWRHPRGPGSDLKGLEEHPVVQIAWEDAAAYAHWAGKSLPTEAQWEFAARGGLKGKQFPWGDELKAGGKGQTNIWQGPFPRRNEALDGFAWTAPVKSYAPNAYGLYDMAGNVWEWCADWYRPDAYTPAPTKNPTGPAQSEDPDEPGILKRVVRGGSFLCTDQYCSGYRVSARMKSSPDTGLSHTGFRCVVGGSDK